MQMVNENLKLVNVKIYFFTPFIFLLSKFCFSKVLKVYLSEYTNSKNFDLPPANYSKFCFNLRKLKISQIFTFILENRSNI